VRRANVTQSNGVLDNQLAVALICHLCSRDSSIKDRQLDGLSPTNLTMGDGSHLSQSPTRQTSCICVGKLYSGNSQMRRKLTKKSLVDKYFYWSTYSFQLENRILDRLETTPSHSCHFEYLSTRADTYRRGLTCCS
jgi:hypothetical protein